MSNTRTVVINSDSDRTYDCLFDPGKWNILHEGSVHTPYLDWEHIDLVLLVGDYSDVDPSMYHQVPDGARDLNKRQDLEAYLFYLEALKWNIPIVGVCKGAQQLCVFNGGSLIQDVSRVGVHVVARTPHHGNGGPEVATVPADHHQVMNLNGVPSCSIWYENFNTGYPEVVVFTNRASPQVGFQFHPEWDTGEGEGRQLFNSVMEDIGCPM